MFDSRHTGEGARPKTFYLRGIHRLAVICASIMSMRNLRRKGAARKGYRLRYRYRPADKNHALDKLFRHLGLYEKENRQATYSGTTRIRRPLSVKR